MMGTIGFASGAVVLYTHRETLWIALSGTVLEAGPEGR